MPTGYTAAIEEGCTFEEYVWGCARAFGACVTMRDDATDKPIPEEFAASDWNANRLNEAKAELARLDAMTTHEVEEAIRVEREEAIAANTKYALENKQNVARYELIRQQVEAWEPPSPNHVEMKKFMLQQIDISLPGVPYQRDLPLTDPAAWLADKKARAQRDLAYHHTEHAKELQRTARRNEWLRQLRASVPQPKSNPASPT